MRDVHPFKATVLTTYATLQTTSKEAGRKFNKLSMIKNPFPSNLTKGKTELSSYSLKKNDASQLLINEEVFKGPTVRKFQENSR